MINELDEEKKFYERFNALHRDRVLVSIFKKFGIEVFRRSSVLENFDRVIKQFGFGGERCVEIGTCNGLTAIVLSRTFKKVVTIDTVDNELKSKIAKFAKVTNIEFISVKDNAEKASVVNALEFDGAYVDGDHARDTEIDFNLVKKSRRVLFHEYWGPQQPVVKLVERLRTSGTGTVMTSGKFAAWIA